MVNGQGGEGGEGEEEGRGGEGEQGGMEGPGREEELYSVSMTSRQTLWIGKRLVKRNVGLRDLTVGDFEILLEENLVHHVMIVSGFARGMMA